jgi:hypothetical protein
VYLWSRKHVSVFGNHFNRYLPCCWWRGRYLGIVQKQVQTLLDILFAKDVISCISRETASRLLIFFCVLAPVAQRQLMNFTYASLPSKSHIAKRKMTLTSKLALGLKTLNISKKFLKLMRPDPSSLNISEMRAAKGL